MSRTSSTLRRLGVPTLAAATLLGGAPLFFGAASAAPNDTVTQTPDTAQTPAGVCNVFTTTINPVRQGVTVDVQLSPRTANVDANFCTLSADGSTATITGNTAGVGAIERGEFVTDVAGQIQFGVIAAQQGVIDVTSFVEDAQQPAPAAVNNTFETSEPNDTSVLTLTQTGLAAVASVDAEPESGAAIAGQNITYTARALNGAGQGVPNVAVRAQITSGPDATTQSVSCGVTDQTGSVDCTLPTGGGVGQDAITTFVNTATGTTATNNFEAGDLNDVITRDLQAALAAGATVTLTADTNRVGGNDDRRQNPLTDETAEFTATVKNAAGQTVSGALVQFSFVNGRVAATTTATTNPERASTTSRVEGADSLSNDVVVTDANGQAKVTVTNPVPVTGDVRGINAVVFTGATSATDTATVEYRKPAPSEARNVLLTPETASRVTGDAQIFSALVTDRFGNPVEGVFVDFQENGPGRFVAASGNRNFTNENGIATGELTSLQGETPGNNVVTADIRTRNTTALDEECELPANTSGFVSNSTFFGSVGTGNQPGAKAGNCTDTSSIVFTANTVSPSGSAGPSTSPSGNPSTGPSATPSVSVSPSNNNQPGRLGISVSPDVIVPSRVSTVRVTGTPGSVVELQAYSRPSTTYTVVRRGTIDSSGVITFQVTPGTNTRLFAAVTGVANTESPSVVINVRTALSLTVVRNGRRNYTFQGRILPRRAGQLISLYRVTSSGSRILTSQVTTDNSGTYRITRQFTGSGTFGFLTRTGQTLTNASGESNTSESNLAAGVGTSRPTAIF